MALVIQTTGLEQYAPGGEARIKVLNIGGPGVGKTRWASYFPRPIYADCEAGLASVADRRVPFVSVRTSTDMLDLLNHLKQECRQPKANRSYDTVVIDTLDAYQRKLKAEWMEANRKEAFSGWEAWGFMNQKMSLLLTRLLNLDMNVIVNVHYKDKSTKDDVTGVETHELMLQLQGETADTAFNDFDLVGWTGTYWEAVNGERVQKRGITFKASPTKPFLKDRLHVTPEWMEIEFAPSDYENLFSRVQAKVAQLAPGENVGEIAGSEPDALSAAVVAPSAVTSGAVPEQAHVEVPLAQLDKPALAKKARDLAITTLPDGTPIKGNTLKAELIAAIEAHQSGTAQAPAPAEPAAPPQAPRAPEPVKPAVSAAPQQPPAVEHVAEGLVDKETGELLETDDGPPAVLEDQGPELKDAVATVTQTLGGQVIAEEEDKEEKKEQATPAASEALARVVEKRAEETATAAVEQAASKPAGAVCDDCGKPLTGENPDYVKLAWIKYRKKLCEKDYVARKSA